MKQQIISDLFAFLTTDSDGIEKFASSPKDQSIMVVPGGGYADMLRPYAQIFANANCQNVRLIRFARAEEIEKISPSPIAANLYKLLKQEEHGSGLQRLLQAISNGDGTGAQSILASLQQKKTIQ